MAYVSVHSAQSMSSSQQQASSQRPSLIVPHVDKQRFVVELSQCLLEFVLQLLPTSEEMAVKEDVRKLLERLIRTIEPDSRLLSFGSTANGFSLRNSDMDLCCLIDSKEKLSASELVTKLGELLERETKFHVKPLPHARIPIVKLSLDPSPGLPLGIACDIGFENRLALENTRLLMCYAMIDPTRVRTMVLFLKVWSKRRKINSPYMGSLSSYGYVLLVIYFLVHVKNPPVLPNLQQMPPLRPINKEDTHVNGHNVWFFDDIELLRTMWHSENTESVAELLIDFFRYFSREFMYNVTVASIRAGHLRKDAKGWQSDPSASRYNDARERNRFCIEDPFETDYNVARCVTKDGLYTIRGEFMRAARILTPRHERTHHALIQLCEERQDETLVQAPATPARRLSSLPPQTPYSVGSQPMRPKGTQATERLSPPTQFSNNTATANHTNNGEAPRPPPHMAPKRGKWTSPPPPEAPSADHTLYQNRLKQGIELATAPTEARQGQFSNYSGSGNSEIPSDEERSDLSDVGSVKSFTEGANFEFGPSRRPMWIYSENGTLRANLPTDAELAAVPPSGRGRIPLRLMERIAEGSTVRPVYQPGNGYRANDGHTSSSREMNRRSWSGPPRGLRVTAWHPSSNSAISELSSVSAPRHQLNNRANYSSNVYYETRSTAPTASPDALYSPGPQFLLTQDQIHQYHLQNLGSRTLHHAPSPSNGELEFIPPLSAGPTTPTPTSYSSNRGEPGLGRPQHSHTYSSSTITGQPPLSNLSKFVSDTPQSQTSIPFQHSTGSPISGFSHSPPISRSSSRNRQRPSPLGIIAPQPSSPLQLGYNEPTQSQPIPRFLQPANPTTSPPTTGSDRSDSPTPSSMYSARSRSFSPSPPPPVEEVKKCTLSPVTLNSPRIPSYASSPALQKSTPLQAYMTPNVQR